MLYERVDKPEDAVYNVTAQELKQRSLNEDFELSEEQLQEGSQILIGNKVYQITETQQG